MEQTLERRTLRFSVLPVAEAVPVARHRTRQWLANRVDPAVAEDCELALSELLGNALQHCPAADRIPVALEIADDGLRVEVSDALVEPPAYRLAMDLDEDGRGLFLLRAISRSWGWKAREDGLPGKTIWALLGEQTSAIAGDA